MDRGSRLISRQQRRKRSAAKYPRFYGPIKLCRQNVKCKIRHSGFGALTFTLPVVLDQVNNDLHCKTNCNYLSWILKIKKIWNNLPVGGSLVFGKVNSGIFHLSFSSFHIASCLILSMFLKIIKMRIVNLCHPFLQYSLL